MDVGISGVGAKRPKKDGEITRRYVLPAGGAGARMLAAFMVPVTVPPELGQVGVPAGAIMPEVVHRKA